MITDDKNLYWDVKIWFVHWRPEDIGIFTEVVEELKAMELCTSEKFFACILRKKLLYSAELVEKNHFVQGEYIHQGCDHYVQFYLTAVDIGISPPVCA